MNNLKVILVLAVCIVAFSCKDNKENVVLATNDNNNILEESLKVIPITHGTLVLETNSEVIYVDPTSGKDAFKNQKTPTLVLITDIHGDHYSLVTLKELNLKDVLIVAPQAVIDKFPEDFNPLYKVLNNSESTTIREIKIEAIPMYNLRKEALKFHTKGRGNGYVLSINNERIYISGDTEDIPEMRNLKDIDKAFVCMNLPYTMPVKSAADAVLEFKPKTVYPYHYRGTDGLSDVNLFKKLVNEKNNSIEVVLLDWY